MWLSLPAAYAIAAILLSAPLYVESAAPDDQGVPEKEKPHKVDHFGDPLPPGAALRIGTTRFKHGDEVIALRFSPNGAILASLGRGEVRLWEVRTAKELGRLEVSSVQPDGLAFSPDGQTLAVGEWEGTIRLFSVGEYREIKRLAGLTGPVSCVTYSPDGKLLAAAGEKPTFAIWELATGKLLRQISVPLRPGIKVARRSIPGDGKPGSTSLQISESTTSQDRTWSLTLTAAGKLLVCGGRGTGEWGYRFAEDIARWDIATGKMEAQGSGSEAPARFAAFAADGRSFLFGGHDTLELWQVDPPRQTKPVRASKKGYLSFALSPDGRCVAAVQWDGIVQILNAGTLEEISTFSRDDGRVTATAFSPDGKLLATTADGHIRLWNPATGQRMDPFQGQEERIENLVYLACGKRISYVVGESIRVRETATGRVIKELPGPSSGLLAPSPDGNVLATVFEPNWEPGGFKKAEIVIWDLASGSIVRRMTVPNGSVTALCFMDNKRLAAASFHWPESEKYKSEVTVWDISTGQPVHIRSVDQGKQVDPLRAPTPRCFSPDGRILAIDTNLDNSGMLVDTRTVMLWDVQRGRKLCALVAEEGFYASAIAFSCDGKTLATVPDIAPIQVWNGETGKLRLRLTTDRVCSVDSIAISPDGRILAAGSYGRIRLWDLRSGKELPGFQGHDRAVSCFAFSPDGKQLASGSLDATLMIWNVPQLPN